MNSYNNVVKCSRFVGGPVRALGLNYDCLPCLAVFVLLAKTELVIAFSKLSMGIPALVSHTTHPNLKNRDGVTQETLLLKLKVSIKKNTFRYISIHLEKFD